VNRARPGYGPVRALLHIAVMALIAAMLGCSSAPEQNNGGADQASRRAMVAELGQRLVGTFSSRAQAERSTDGAPSQRLVVSPLWPERTDGPWLYLEQAPLRRLQTPVRQWVLHLVAASDTDVRAEFYDLPGDPLGYAGGFARPSAFAQLQPHRLIPRSERDLLLARATGGDWTGATQGNGRTGADLGAMVVGVDRIAMAERTAGAARAAGSARAPADTRGSTALEFDRLSHLTPAMP